MKRRMFVLALALAMAIVLMPGCASRANRTLGYAAGILTSAVGLVWAGSVVANPTRCDDSTEENEDPLLCLDAFADTIVRFDSALVVTMITSYLHRNDREVELRHPGRARREKLR
jgi:hypothetical protein